MYLCRPMTWRRTVTSSTRRWPTEPTLWLWVGSEPASDRSPLSEETAHCRSTFFLDRKVSNFTTVMFRSFMNKFRHCRRSTFYIGHGKVSNFTTVMFRSFMNYSLAIVGGNCSLQVNLFFGHGKVRKLFYNGDVSFIHVFI